MEPLREKGLCRKVSALTSEGHAAAVAVTFPASTAQARSTQCHRDNCPWSPLGKELAGGSIVRWCLW